MITRQQSVRYGRSCCCQAAAGWTKDIAVKTQSQGLIRACGSHAGAPQGKRLRDLTCCAGGAYK